jgi:sporulation protein YunB
MLGEGILMLKNSNVYRRYRYFKKRKARKWFIALVLTTIIILLALIMSYTEKSVLPYLSQTSEQNARSIVNNIVDSVVKEEFSNNVGYDDLVSIEKGADGGIKSIETNIYNLNKLSERITGKVREKLSAVKEDDLSVPIGGVLGSSILSGLGPGVHMKLSMDSSLKISLKSEFLKVSEEQTYHRITLQIDTAIKLSIPFRGKTIDIINSIPVAETLIVGEVPAFYMNSDELPVKQ